MKAVASLAFVNGQLSNPTMQRIDLTWLEDLVQGVSDEELVVTICASPAATHLQGSSVCDQGLAFTTARAAGKARKWALAAAAAAAGGGSVVLAYVAKQYIASPPVAPSPTPQQPAPPAPSKPDTLIPPVPVGIGGQLTYEDWLTVDFMERNGKLAPDDARIGARECIRLTTFAVESGADILQGLGGKHPCEALPIFVPGRTPYAPANQPSPATVHYFDAITATPRWIRLNWFTQADRIASGLSLKWKVGAAACANNAADEDCDEYPFFSSAQSGNAGFAGPPGASLRPVFFRDNRSIGAKYRWFGIERCHLTSGGTDKTQAALVGSPLLVIPLASRDAPATFEVC